MSAHVVSRESREAPPKIRPDGTIPARCPSCGTVGTMFRPEPGAYIVQRCRRRECGIMFAIYVWPHWSALPAPAVDASRPAD